MTVTVVMASLVPIMWSTGVGSDVMKPIAAPIIGGMITSTIHVLIITPVIFYIMKMRALRKGTLRAFRNGAVGRLMYPVLFRIGEFEVTSFGCHGRSRAP